MSGKDQCSDIQGDKVFQNAKVFQKGITNQIEDVVILLTLAVDVDSGCSLLTNASKFWGGCLPHPHLLLYKVLPMVSIGPAWVSKPSKQSYLVSLSLSAAS